MPADPRDLRRGLFDLAAGQGGYFTAADARRLGYSYQAQAHHVGAGNWFRVDRGLFRLRERVPEHHDDLARWSVWSRGVGVVSHETALAVVEVGELESARVHLTVPRGFRRHDDGVVLHHADLHEADVVDHGAFRVTSVVRSLVDVAAAGVDEDQLARAVAEAVATGHATLRGLRARAEQVDLRGASRLERAVALLDA